MQKVRCFVLLSSLIAISYLASLIPLNKVFGAEHREGSPCRMDSGSMGALQWSGERLICAITEGNRRFFNSGPSDRELLEREREHNRELQRRNLRLEKCAELAEQGSYPRDCPYDPGF